MICDKPNGVYDARDLDALMNQVYAPDAIDDRRRGTPWRGHGEVRSMFAQALEAFEATAHLLMNVEVSIEDDDARAYSRVLACHWFAGTAALGKARPSECILVGSYTDRLHRFDYGWRIVHREVDALGPAGLLAGLMPVSFRGFGGVAT